MCLTHIAFLFIFRYKVKKGTVMNLIALRKMKHLTAKQVADLLGVSRAHFTHLENGSRMMSAEIINKLASIYRVSPDLVSEGAKDLEFVYRGNMSWLTKLKYQGTPVVKLFVEHVKKSKYEIGANDFETKFKNFVLLMFESSLNEELRENSQLIDLLKSKALYTNQNKQ